MTVRKVIHEELGQELEKNGFKFVFGEGFFWAYTREKDGTKQAILIARGRYDKKKIKVIFYSSADKQEPKEFRDFIPEKEAAHWEFWRYKNEEELREILSEFKRLIFTYGLDFLETISNPYTESMPAEEKGGYMYEDHQELYDVYFRMAERKIIKKEIQRVVKRIAVFAAFLVLAGIFLYRNIVPRETQFFSPEELEGYEAPIAFLISNSEKYFITLDNPDKKYILDYYAVWDSKSSNRTFLFNMKAEENEGIYEFDLNEEKYRCLIDEDSVRTYLNLSEDSEFESVYYYFDEGTISFLYGDYLIIYDVYGEEFIFCNPFVLRQWQDVYGWRTPQTLLMNTEEHGNPHTICEVNIYTGEKTKVADDLGNTLILTEDKSMGSSAGDENWFGVIFNPVLVWDTQNYKVKRFREGSSSGRTQLSDDKKYVMFTRHNSEQPNQILCIKVEDESMCEVYSTEDWIYDIIWW